MATEPSGIFRYVDRNPRIKMLALNAALLGSLVFILYLSLHNATEKVIYDYVKGTGTAITTDFARRAAIPITTQSQADAAALLEQISHLPGVVHVALYYVDATIFSELGQPLNWRPAFKPPLTDAAYYQVTDEQLHIVVPIYELGQRSGPQIGFAHAAFQNDEATRIFRRVSSKTILASVIVLLIFMVYGAMQITNVFRSIDRDHLVLSSTAQVAEFERRQSVDSLESNRVIIRRMNEEAEKIYRDITREIHDQLGAQLVDARANIIEARRLTNDLPESKVTDEIIERLDHSREEISDSYLRLRDIVNRLRPDVLDMLGLRGGIEDYARGWAERGGYQLDLGIAGDLDNCGDELSMTVYRIVQEALTNITKHAHAKHVQIRLALVVDSGKDYLELIVADDGVGFTPNTGVPKRGMGMRGMTERVMALGGQIFFDRNRNGAGARIEVRIPIVKPDAA